MKDSTRRGLRTALQLVVTAVSTGLVVSLLNAVGLNITAEEWAAISAVVLPFTTVFQNALEDAGTIPAYWKAPASDGANPVPGSDSHE